MGILDLPPDHWLRVAHKHSSNHRQEITDSFQCGCFHCRHLFKPQKIIDWVDGGTTAMCPKYVVAGVIGDSSPFDIDEKFLEAMQRVWF
ncbi:hypothetical protein GCM10011309_03520 [Litorimonas cladophorae]|uniref:Uncharacterized protein n=1 Tax=Litorimonas cladophorae TaxID=1220491 RepID=A0A918NCJ5_9PROT|nr:hypothetical protein GCM10011309_03520 [Litorimonas cladophorae]